MYLTPWVLRIIIANVILFVLTAASPALYSAMVFVPAFIILRPWTIVTYMFLHAGLGHILFNMLALFFFGPRLELEFGGRNFLILYFVSGITGALLSFVFSPFAAIVGASGAVYGVMLGFAYLWPRERIYIWGVIPIEARILIIVMTGLSLIGGVGEASGSAGDGVAHFAHLGGFLGGFITLRLLQSRARKTIITNLPPPNTPTSTDLKRWLSVDRSRLHEVNREEFDRIIEKLKTAGPASLTPEERNSLDRFSSI